MAKPKSSAKASPQKAKPVAAKASAKKPAPVAAKPAMPEAQPDACCGGGASCCGTESSCCGMGGMGGMFSFCPLFQVLSTSRFWIGCVLAFVTIFVFDILWQGNLMEAYRATAGLWKPEGAMDIKLFYLVQLLTAFVVTAMVQLMGQKGWWGSMVAGVLATSPLAINALTAYITMPFPDGYIPTMWAVGSLLEGALVGLMLHLVFRQSGCACGEGCGCGPTCDCEK